MKPKHLLLIIAMIACTQASVAEDTISYSIHPQATRQKMEGWGVSLCWWANMCGKWSDKKIDEIVDWMVSPTGLNYNIFRYNIGGGDDPLNRNCDPHHMAKGKGLRAEMEGFQDEPGGEYHWDRDEAQRKIMLKIKEKRPDAIFEAFSNSAPWWMTYSGCCSGNTSLFKDNLKPEYYDDFAHYLVDVCKHYKDTYGIEFKTLEPFNEPALNTWRANGEQEGCYFSTTSQVNFLKVLSPILKESELNTIISSADESWTSQSVTTLKYYINNDAMDMVGQWNTHTYQASDRTRSQVGSLARAAGKPIWMSEVGDGSSGLAGNLKLCQKFFDDMHYILPTAWIDWQYIEEGNDQWCTVQANFNDENSAHLVPNYYVRQHVTKFIRQGYTMVTALSNKTLAAVNPTKDTLVVVILNNTDQRVRHHIKFPEVHINGDIKAYLTMTNSYMREITNDFTPNEEEIVKVNLPAQSIITLIMPYTMETQSQEVEDNGTYLIIPQSNCNMALSAHDGNVTIEPVDMESPCQQWTLKKHGNEYTLTNAEGQTITDSGNYALQTNNNAVEGQTFAIEPVEDFFYKIINASGNAFDLEKSRLTAGTVVGLAEYGNSVDADTRNWQLVRLTDKITNGINTVNTSSVKSSGQYYDILGRKLNGPKRGINIYISDGKAVKRIIK